VRFLVFAGLRFCGYLRGFGSILMVLGVFGKFYGVWGWYNTVFRVFFGCILVWVCGRVCGGILWILRFSGTFVVFGVGIIQDFGVFVWVRCLLMRLVFRGLLCV